MTVIDSHARPPTTATPDGGHAAHGEGHDHAHSEYPFLAHHFETPAQQFDSAKLGMWVFLATEILFFGALFAMYAIMRAREPDVFAYASHYLNTIMGGINTCVLIASSLTMATAVYCAQRNKRTACVLCLCLTFLGAVGFLVIKYFEYSHKIHAHLVWGEGFYKPVEHDAKHEPAGEAHAAAPTTEQAVAAAPPAAAGAPVAWTTSPATGVAPLIKTPTVEASTVKRPAAGPTGVATERPLVEEEPSAEKVHLDDPNLPPDTHRFFGIYYCMTGLHGIHVVVGMFLIGGLIVQTARGKYSSAHYTPIDLVGLYWHIVDLIWIFLFPLFYLIH